MRRRSATVVDIAQRAQVSIATVSRVLNGASGHPVRAATRERVLAAARHLNYEPSDLARSLVQRTTRTIGLVIPDITNPYYPELVRATEDTARERGYTVVVLNTDREPDRVAAAIRVLRQKRVDGLLFAGGGTQPQAEVRELKRADTPIVVIGRHHLPFASVRIDNARGAREAVIHLLERGLRRIACLAGPPHLTSVQDRIKGYRSALHTYGLPDSPALLRYGDFQPESGYREALALLRSHPRPDAIFALNDRMAIGVLAAVADLGLQSPKDVSVVGFDDIPIASYLRPSLTTVHVPAYEIGRAAMGLLLAAIQGKRPPRVVRLRTRLIARQSSAAPSRSPLHHPQPIDQERRTAGA